MVKHLQCVSFFSYFSIKNIVVCGFVNKTESADADFAVNLLRYRDEILTACTSITSHQSVDGHEIAKD